MLQNIRRILLCGSRERTPANCCKHFWARIVVGDGDHRLHQPQFRIVRHGKEIPLLLFPPDNNMLYLASCVCSYYLRGNQSVDSGMERLTALPKVRVTGSSSCPVLAPARPAGDRIVIRRNIRTHTRNSSQVAKANTG